MENTAISFCLAVSLGLTYTGTNKTKTGDPSKKQSSWLVLAPVMIRARISIIEAAIVRHAKYEIHRAFTSQISIDKLKKRMGLKSKIFEEAINIWLPKVSALVVQSTHHKRFGVQ